ncbi:MAG: hypothetical protein J0653_04730 [Deltaproteobacteria bacterium]|nr:hypothetical protein [Deltaproteobacteria bacterium]
MKSQDIVLLLKLVALQQQEKEATNSVTAANYTVRGLAEATGISKSEVSNSLNRCTKIGLAKPDRKSNIPRTNVKALTEFIIYGLKYVFPAEVKEISRGIPTSFAAPVLQGKIMSAGELIYVWPDANGSKKGRAVTPLCKSVALAIAKDPLLYEYLALVDAVRLGNPREVEVAKQALSERLGAL